VTLRGGGNTAGAAPTGNCTVGANGACAATGGHTAITSTLIVSNSPLNATIGGDLTIEGGVATATPVGGQVANAEAIAGVQTAGDLTLTVGGKLSILGGMAQAASAGTSATADATGLLDTSGRNTIHVGNNFIVTGGLASASGTGAEATARAGTTSGTASGVTMDVTVGGGMKVTGGKITGTGIAEAAMLSAGEIKVDVVQGLQLVGGNGSNLFHFVGGSVHEVLGTSYPITITGGWSHILDTTLTDAFFLSGSPPLNLDRLLSDFLKSTDCVSVSGGACTLPGIGPRPGDPVHGPQAGVCK
jgi:hypothetical protein